MFINSLFSLFFESVPLWWFSASDSPVELARSWSCCLSSRFRLGRFSLSFLCLSRCLLDKPPLSWRSSSPLWFLYDCWLGEVDCNLLISSPCSFFYLLGDLLLLMLVNRFLWCCVWLARGILDVLVCVILVVVGQHLNRSPYLRGWWSRLTMWGSFTLRVIMYESRSPVWWDVSWDVKKFWVHVQLVILNARR